MSVEIRLIGSQSGFQNFVELGDDEDIDPALVFLDSPSSSNRVIATFIFDGLNIEFIMDGQFQNTSAGMSLLEFGQLNRSSIVTGEEFSVDDSLQQKILYKNGITVEQSFTADTRLSELQTIYAGNDELYAPSFVNREDSSAFNGYGGNDKFYAFGSSRFDDVFHGGDGIDTLIYSAEAKNYTIRPGDVWNPATEKNIPGGFSITDTTGRDGRIQTYEVERIQFSDSSLALDLNGNAGQVAKLLGAVFGAESVSDKNYVGIGLRLLDGGMSYQGLAALAVSAAGKSSSTDVCTLLWTNVMGSAPTTADIAPFKAMLDSGQMSIGSLTTLAADTSLNTANIGLVGLSQTGLEFV